MELLASQDPKIQIALNLYFFILLQMLAEVPFFLAENWRPWRQLAGIPLSFESLELGQSSKGGDEYDGVEQES